MADYLRAMFRGSHRGLRRGRGSRCRRRRSWRCCSGVRHDTAVRNGTNVRRYNAVLSISIVIVETVYGRCKSVTQRRLLMLLLLLKRRRVLLKLMLCYATCRSVKRQRRRCVKRHRSRRDWRG